MITEKRNYMRSRERLESLILQLEATDISIESRNVINKLKLEIEDLLVNTPNDDHKLFLKEIIDIEKPVFGSNNLILAPVGSGKSVFIKSSPGLEKGNMLMLVSNRYLKESVSPSSLKAKEIYSESGMANMMVTTQNKTLYGNKEHLIYVMTYAEFGNKIEFNDDFIDEYNFVEIHCDEIHSLPEYKNIDKSESLIHAIRYLFNRHERHNIFYYTATKHNLAELEKSKPGIMRYIKTFDYRNHPDIRKYMALSEYKITHIEQIRAHLKARLLSFNYFGHKGLAFNRTISGQRQIANILTEEGYIPLILWSDSNDEHPLTESQIKARDELILTNKIPKPYNFLVINSAMREGWDLKDPKLKLAIMNTTNPTDKIQALGRIRKDIDILIYKTVDDIKETVKINIPDIFLNTPLTVELKSNLSDTLNIINNRGHVMKWRGLKEIIENNGYKVEDSKFKFRDSYRRVSTITLEL